MERMVMRMRSFCEILSNGVIMRKRECVEGTAVYRIESIFVSGKDEGDTCFLEDKGGGPTSSFWVSWRFWVVYCSWDLYGSFAFWPGQLPVSEE